MLTLGPELANADAAAMILQMIANIAQLYSDDSEVQLVYSSQIYISDVISINQSGSEIVIRHWNDDQSTILSEAHVALTERLPWCRTVTTDHATGLLWSYSGSASANTAHSAIGYGESFIVGRTTDPETGDDSLGAVWSSYEMNSDSHIRGKYDAHTKTMTQRSFMYSAWDFDKAVYNSQFVPLAPLNSKEYFRDIYEVVSRKELLAGAITMNGTDRFYLFDTIALPYTV